MEDEKTDSTFGVSEREGRFLDHLSRKYEKSESAGRLRSYVIVSVVIMALFAVARCVPWWGVSLCVVEAVGLALFHQYKRFGSFKSRLLRKLWRHLKEVSE